MEIEIIDLEFVFFALSALAIAVSSLTLVVWVIIMRFNLEEIDDYFDSPDFPNRGVKGIWPFGSGRALTYGIFLLFPNSRFVKKNFHTLVKQLKLMSCLRKLNSWYSFRCIHMFLLLCLFWRLGFSLR